MRLPLLAFVVCGLTAAIAAVLVCITPPPGAVATSRAADLAQCQADHGPGAIAVELPDGSHRCRASDGRRLALGGLPLPTSQLAQVQP